MKLAVTPFNVSSIRKLAEKGADIFIVGNNKFANRLTKSFTEMEISEAIDLCNEIGKEIYININIIAHHNDLEDIDRFLEFLSSRDVHGIIYGDLSVYQLAKQHKMEHILIYNPETLNTNFYDPIFWGKKGIKGLTIAKEISLDDLGQIHAQSPIELSMIGHGHLNMFHSRRPLIENFFKYRKEEYDKYIENRNLRLVEEIRNESYPVFQDDHGTHIFREKAMESYQEIDRLRHILDVFIIDGIFKDTSYLEEVIENYRSLLDQFNMDSAQSLSKTYEKDHDSGFLYKKTVYDKY